MAKKQFKHGEIHWSEYCTENAEQSVDFCRELFGWEVMFQPNENEYFLKHDETPIVSIFQRDDAVKKDGVPPHVKNYVAVKDHGGTLAEALENGAELIMENEQEGKNKLAVLRIPGEVLVAIVEYYE